MEPFNKSGTDGLDDDTGEELEVESTDETVTAAGLARPEPESDDDDEGCLDIDDGQDLVKLLSQLSGGDRRR